MIGGKQPSGSQRGHFPQFEFALVELENNELKKTLLSTKLDRISPNMPRSGFYRHCTEKLGDDYYIIGGGQPANLGFHFAVHNFYEKLL